jgi:hypothetical protein
MGRAYIQSELGAIDQDGEAVRCSGDTRVCACGLSHENTLSILAARLYL